MQFDIGELIRALQDGVSLVPATLIAVVLLAGPTVLWVLYRFVVQPRANRLRSLDASAMWVCPRCRSVNELRLSRCYRCDARPTEADLEFIEADPVGPTRLRPVGPGHDITRGAPYGLPYIGPASTVSKAPAESQAYLPVGPAKPDVARPRRAVVAGRSRGPNDPTAA